MSLKYLNDVKYIKEIEKIYLESFPKEERFPFWILQECSKENNSDLFAIVEKNMTVGMCYIVKCNSYCYLMYLAIEPSLRNKKYGSKVLKDLKEKYSILFLSVEEPFNNMSLRRKNFYLNNGFFNTNIFYEDTGVNYEILCTDDKCKITNNLMKMRYTKMTNNEKIFDEILNTFNVNNINIKIRDKGSDNYGYVSKKKNACRE